MINDWSNNLANLSQYVFVKKRLQNALKLILMRVLIVMVTILSSTQAISNIDTIKKQTSLPDFRKIKNFKHRREAFCIFLRPLAQEENQKIWDTRQKVLRLLKKNKLNTKQQVFLKSIYHQYNIITTHMKSQSSMTILNKRLDIIPVPLLIAQAAIESAWGKSRFAREGNNLFGQRCFKKGCGIIPNNRPKNKEYEVKKFNNVSQSITSYIDNLNTNSHYKLLRTLRFKLRQQNIALDSIYLANGLKYYSKQKQDYVKKVQHLIANSHLDNCHLTN